MTSGPTSPDPQPAPARPVLLYDADCAFCVRWVERWKKWTGDRVEYAPAQGSAGRFPRVPASAMQQSVWLIEPDGRLLRGAAAVFRALSTRGGRARSYLWAYKHVPGFAPVSEGVYNTVAAHRDIADALERRLFLGRTALHGSQLLTRSLFLRSLGAVYLVAFLSLFVQIKGLVGSHGILPVNLLLENARLQDPELSAIGRFLRLPTLCWLNSSDGFLQSLCAAGAVCALGLILEIFPAPLLFLCWLFYLSLVHAGQEFLGFQWDVLLLEAGFLAIFYAPLQLRLWPALLWGRGRVHPAARPSRLMRFLLRWLTFRLMFLSGLVKLLADRPPAWRDFTAMRYHYQTQPLPAWTSWYAHQAPNWFQSFSVGGVFFIELLIPIFFFAPRPLRLFAAAMTVFLQLLIALTGNFGFFNLLAIVMCIPLLDDAALARLRIRTTEPTVLARGKRWPRMVLVPLAVGIFVLSLVPSLYRVHAARALPAPLVTAYLGVAPFDVTNAYGLFESMTTRRPELIIEGSDDGQQWLAYEFKWKPGRTDRRPQFCEPQMPRLDWQMWFAALGVFQEGQSPVWLGNLLVRLHEGSPDVLGLFAVNPFPSHPPRYLRVALYDYRFTDSHQRAQTGDWWQRQLLDPSVLSLAPRTSQ